MMKKLEPDSNANVGTCLAQLGYAEVPEMFAKGLTVDVSEFADKYIVAFQPDEVPNWLSGQAAAAGSSWYNPVNDEWVVTVTD